MPHLATSRYGTFTVWLDPVGQAIERGHFWDVQLRDAMDKVDPTGWAIDIGANVGFHTVHLAHRFVHVLALEAHPSTYELLCANLAANKVEAQVTARHLAAYNIRTVLCMASPEMLGWPVPSEMDLDQCANAASVAFVPLDVASGSLQVPAGDVDSVIEDLGAPRVTFIKVDAQGCDLRALYGMSRLITRDSPSIVFEYEKEASLWHGDTLTDYLRFFRERRYRVTKIHKDFEDYYAVKM